MPDPWSREECQLIVADYFDMLRAELSGSVYNKAEHRRLLASQLNGRSGGSIEYKHQNISAILIEMGSTYISGYKPAFNYQALLASTIGCYLDQYEPEFEKLAEAKVTDPAQNPTIQNWKSFLSGIPLKSEPKVKLEVKEFVPKRYNFSEREQNNRRLGEQGERFVLNFEKARLVANGKNGLAEAVEWTSKERGDGAGYDIRSFNIEDESPRYIEVKTTNSGKYQPFYISDNELSFSRLNESSWSLYRVFDFRSKPKLFTLAGCLSNYVKLKPKVFVAGF